MKMIVFPLWLDSNKELHYPFLGSRVIRGSRFLMIFMIRHKSYMRVTTVTLDSLLEPSGFDVWDICLMSFSLSVAIAGVAALLSKCMVVCFNAYTTIYMKKLADFYIGLYSQPAW